MSPAARARFAAVFVLIVGASSFAHAKGRARSFQLEGIIQPLPQAERPEQFAFRGDLIVLDCRQECVTATWQAASRMDVQIRFRKGQFFRVWAPDRRAAAVSEPETMFDVIRDAAAHGHRVRLDLVDPTVQFGPLGDVKRLEAELDGITDHHLK